MASSIIKALQISSCSDVFVRRNTLTGELEVLLHPQAVLRVDSDTLVISHSGETRLRKRAVPPILKMGYYALMCFISLITWQPIFVIMAIMIFGVDRLLLDIPRLEPQYVVRRFDASSCINSLVTNSMGDITLYLDNLAPHFRIESNGSGDISLARELKENFHSLEVILNRKGSIHLGNASTKKATLILNGDGSISNVKIMENGSVSLVGNGTIVYSRLTNTMIERNFSGTGTLKEMKD